jgi:hypothetical protein
VWTGYPAADVLLRIPALTRTQVGPVKLDLALAKYAPPRWARDGRQAIISFWMDSTGLHSQARFLLGYPCAAGVHRPWSEARAQSR